MRQGKSRVRLPRDTCITQQQPSLRRRMLGEGHAAQATAPPPGGRRIFRLQHTGSSQAQQRCMAAGTLPKRPSLLGALLVDSTAAVPSLANSVIWGSCICGMLSCGMIFVLFAGYGELWSPPHQVSHSVPALRPPLLPHPEEHLRLLRLPRRQDPQV